MAALVAVMFMVSFSTFDWQSIRRWRLTPASEMIVMVATVVTVIATHNLAQGELFFASTEGFVEGIDFHEHPRRVKIDLSEAHVWDGSAIAAIDKIVLKLRSTGSDVKVIGLNEASAILHERLATHDKVDALNSVSWH